MLSAADLVIPKFHDALGDVMAHGHTHYWLYGGRGSTKSSFVSLCLVLLVIAFPYANAVAVRRYGNTLRDSVYQQVLWAISSLGLEAYFKAKLSPMEITYLPTGQRIVFRGADDPLKLKGIKFTKGHPAVIWFEELDQFDGIEAVRSILDSLRRGGDSFWIFYSYNPPRTMWSWVNVESLERAKRADTLVRCSFYLDVVESHPEWLGDPFIDEAEYLRDINETAWRWEYLGEATGTGGNVFTNIHDERLSLSRIRNFERTRSGVDWGWFPDPWRFVRCAWEPSARRLLIFEEHSTNRKTPAETAQILLDAMTFPDEEGKEPYFHDEIVWADDTPDGEGVLTASSTPDAIREIVASGRICTIGKYVGLGFTPWDGVTGATHRQHLTSATFAPDMAAFTYLNFQYLFYSCTSLASVSGLGNLAGVRSMRFMFASSAVTELDFRGFDPSALTDLYYAFSSCSKLTTIYAGATWALPASGIS